MTLLLAGVDEAGRGPLAGPVMAAAVILDPAQPIAGLADSKRLTAARREQLALCIRESSLAWCIAEASVEEIDRYNILQATLLAMTRAVEGLGVRPQEVWVDGNHLPDWSHSSRAVVGGDARVAEISAASILAKVARDAHMLEMDAHYPEYGFRQHKGYPTAAHMQSLRRHGPCKIHRRSYGPVRQVSLLTEAPCHG